MDPRIADLEAYLNELSDLEAAQSLLGWDQVVNMPPAGAETRAVQMATLSKVIHGRLTSDRLANLLAEARQGLDGAAPHSFEAGLVRATERLYALATRVPTDLVAEMTRLQGLSQTKWAEARAQQDYDHFKPWLAQLLDLTRQQAEHLGYDDHPYDALLDLYEPEMRAAEVETLFKPLREGLIEVVRLSAERETAVDASFLFGKVPRPAQEELGREVAAALGFDFDRGRLDTAVHPFATGVTIQDVRLTTRYDEHFFASALFGTMHETGHGLYEQGFDPRFRRTPLANASSLGFHESQSRLWENFLGRSLPFWQHFYPRLKALAPDQFERVDVQHFYRAINRVKPTLIRVEADEVTYNLHIMLRFELEKALLTDDLSVDELPGAWDDLMESYLGVRPDNAATGVLQDIHWSIGLYGYFPTYALGNLLAAQLFARMRNENPDFDEQVAGGDFVPFLSWMREHVQRHGALYTPQELAVRATGSPIGTDAYLAYIRGKYGAIYGF